MAHRTWTAAVCAGAGAALLAGLLVPGSAAASQPPVASASAAAVAAAAAVAQQRESGPVTRLIVRMADRGPVTDGVVAAAARGAGVERAAAARRLAGGAQLVLLSAPVTAEKARGLARALAARPDVAAAEPDILLTTAEASPVTPDDDRFGEQWALWDTAAASPGGFGSRAPAAWARTSGSPDVVVAVVDTGITAHPDLDANVVPGYDFVSLDDVAPYAGTNMQPLTANDGNGRDADPRDPGNWISAAEANGLGFFGDRPECFEATSNWHGTHVAGIVAAVRGNGIGVSGAAPGVKVQPLRAVGKCGGYLSDIADAIRWAAGGTGAGLPAANPTPADVINLSLGGAGTCAAGGYLQQAIDYAHAAGSVVVAAAGNGISGVGIPVAGDPGSQIPGTLPANCANVVTVASVTREGARAVYSNYGPEVDLAAPGGRSDTPPAAFAVLSTLNSGLQGPAVPSYGSLAGTSMATPHVAAAAALLQSTRIDRAPLTPDQVLAELQGLVQPFPEASGCADPTPCGAGILDLSQPLPELEPLPVPGGRADPLDESVALSWSPSPDAGAAGEVTYVVSAGAVGLPLDVVGSTTGTTLTVTGLVNGTTYAFSVLPRNSALLEGTPTALGEATPVPDADALPSRPSGLVAQPRALALDISWDAAAVPAGASPVASYAVQHRLLDADWPASPADASGTSWQLDGVAAGVYEVRVAAVNEAGETGPWSDVLAVDVAAQSTTISVSNGAVRPLVDGYQDSVDVTITTNRAEPVTYEIVGPAPASTVLLSEVLDGAGPWAQTFAGAIGTRLPNGTYTLRVRQDDALGGPERISSATVVVASSPLTAPRVLLSPPTLYWYPDGYQDTLSVTVTTNVPATQSWRLTNSTGSFTYRTWSFPRSRSATTTWTGFAGGKRLPDGTYYLRATAKGGDGSTRTTVVKVLVSSKKLRQAAFTRTVYPAGVSIQGLNGGAPTLVDGTFDGITRKVLHVYGGFDPDTLDGSYDVLSLSAALPSSVIPATGVKVATCLRPPDSATGTWGPPGTNLLGGGYMRSSTSFTGWFAALLDESPAPVGQGQFTLSPGYIACLKPNLSTPASAMAGGRIRWSLFNWATSSSAYVPVHSFTITGTRYYLA